MDQKHGSDASGLAGDAVPPIGQWGQRWAERERLLASQRQERSPRAKGFSERTAQLYLARWDAFCQYLAEHKATGSAFTQAQIDHFISTRTVRAANRPAHQSRVTNARYNNNLTAILLFANILGWCEFAADAPMRQQENDVQAQSLAITPQLMDKVCRQISLANTSFAQCRDSLILHLVCIEALTVQEICALANDAVQWDNQGHSAKLQVSGPRKAQNRTIALHPGALALLLQWQRWCENHPPSDRLLRSLPGKRTITAVSIYTVCAQALRQALGEHAQELLPYHVGPNVLRNTRLAILLAAGVPRQDVAARAGLQSSRWLKRIDDHASGFMQATVRR